jgi:hypothetical protein
MECPECGTEIGNASACGCGWRKIEPKGPSRSGLVDPELGYIRCEWTANGERCRYPGSLTTNTRAGGPWYCGPHFRCKDPIAGLDILEASRDYVPETEEEIMEARRARALQWCKERGLNTVAEMRAYVRSVAQGIGRKK